MPSLPFDERVQTAAQLSWRSRMLFEVFCVYGGEGEFAEVGDCLRDYPWFFMLQSHANQFAAFVYLAGLFKKDPTTINLPDLVDEALADKTLEMGDSSRLKGLLGSQPNALEGVKTIRNKAFSHRDVAINMNGVFKLANITPDDVRALSDVAIEVANTLCRSRDLKGVVANVGDLHRDAKRVFTALGARFERRARRPGYDELFGGS